jgi:uncharacterized HhH-GPD family protein
MRRMTLCLAQDEAADRLLSEDAFALLMGMLLDQQVPMEKAFSAPHLLQERLGRALEPSDIAQMDGDELVNVFSQAPALHRFPGSMAQRVQALARRLVERYGGDAAAVWQGAGSGAELLGRLQDLPGFGKQKAQIFLALLGKQLGVRPEGWREAAGTFGEDGVHRSVADITDAESLSQVRQYKKQMKAAAKAAPPS